MEPEGSLPHSQQPATCPCPEPDQSSPVRPSHFLNILHNIILPSMRGSSKWPLSIRFSYQNLYTPLLFPIRAICTAHLFFLDLITRIIFGEQYRSISPPLCSFLHSHIMLCRTKHKEYFFLVCPYWTHFTNFPTSRYHLRRLSWSPT